MGQKKLKYVKVLRRRRPRRNYTKTSTETTIKTTISIESPITINTSIKNEGNPSRVGGGRCRRFPRRSHHRLKNYAAAQGNICYFLVSTTGTSTNEDSSYTFRAHYLTKVWKLEDRTQHRFIPPAASTSTKRRRRATFSQATASGTHKEKRDSYGSQGICISRTHKQG